MTKRITFILSGSAHDPVGGFKVVYEYANELCKRGWEVAIIHPSKLEDGKLFFYKAKKIIRYFQRKLNKSYLPNEWFSIMPEVQMLWVPSLNERYIPDADYIVACPCQSAQFVASYGSEKGKKLYFIQHFEDWGMKKDELVATWRLPLIKIVIANWLQKIAIDLGEKAYVIPNGLDHGKFDIDFPIESREPEIVFLAHNFKWKGSDITLSALIKVKKSYPSIKISAFGTSSRPKHYPGYIDYFQNPSQVKLKKLYNKCSIFITSSISEGWGLPACEAMQCGCAVIATDIGGHAEFAIENKTALLSRVNDVDSVFLRVIQLLQDDDLRVNIAKNGHEYVKKYAWGKSADEFEKVLRSI